MASAVDKQPAAARLSAVAAAGCLPTATRGSQSSYTTLWDTTEQYAYRPGRSAHDAVKRVHSLLNTGHNEVVQCDLSVAWHAPTGTP